MNEWAAGGGFHADNLYQRLIALTNELQRSVHDDVGAEQYEAQRQYACLLAAQQRVELSGGFQFVAQYADACQLLPVDLFVPERDRNIFLFFHDLRFELNY